MLDWRDLTNESTTATSIVNREAAFHDFAGFYRVTDTSGAIDTGNGIIHPGEAGYAQAAVNVEKQ